MECFLGAQRGPKGSPKWSKIDQKEVQKRYLEKGTKKALKMMIFRPPECGQSIVNSSKIDDFRCSVLGPFWVSFWECFWSPNGGQEPQKEVLKSLSNLGRKSYQFLIHFGVPFGVQNGAKNGLKTDLGSSRGSRGSQGSILEGFWTNVGPILG